LGIELARSADELEDANEENFEAVCKKVSAYLETSAKNERATILSIKELAPESEMLQQKLNLLIASVEQVYTANRAILDAKMESKTNEFGNKVSSFKLTKLEKSAKDIVPSVTDNLKNGSFGIERTVRELPEETLAKFPYSGIANTTELCALINGKNSALDIKKMLDTQYNRESDLQSVLNYLKLLKAKGLIQY
jgi:hypothetical protein